MPEERKQLCFRIPVSLASYLEKQAQITRRSLSSEILYRLEETVKADKRPSSKNH